MPKDRGTLDAAGEEALQQQIDDLRAAIKAATDETERANSELAAMRAGEAESAELLRNAHEERARAMAMLEEAAQLVAGARPKNPPRPDTVVKEGGVDLGPPGDLIARDRFVISAKSGYGGQGNRITFEPGEWLPESLPADVIAEQMKQRPCTIWDTKHGPFMPRVADTIPAPVVLDQLKGLFVKPGRPNFFEGSVFGLPPV